MDILKNLGDGLVLRRATTDDTDALVDLQIHAFANPDTNEPDIYLGGWTRDLMSGKHPTFKPDDFLVVQDTKTGALVSCMCLISQTWSLAVTPNARNTTGVTASEMDGIPFRVGRPEIVGTLKDYRRRGLVREQFRVIHEWSQQRGELVQAITGIPFFYRQFGYEYAIHLVAPRQTFIPQQIPELKTGAAEKFRLRRAAPVDLSFVAALYKQSASRSLLHCERDEKMLAYEQFDENHPLSGSISYWDVIETLDGERAGIVHHRRYVHQGRHTSDVFEILPQFAWAEVVPDVLRALAREAQTYDAHDKQPLTKLGWFLDENHPFYKIMPECSAPLFGGYAWYVRVPDLPAFLRHIAPVLEKRLAASDFRAYSGALRVHFYPRGIELIFANGKLENVQPWRATAGDFGQSGFGSAAFPELTFLKLLFGYRSRAELQFMFSDVLTDGDETNALLDALFPKQSSNILPIH